MSVEDEILQSFLENASKSAVEEIKNEGKLSEKNAIPLILKTQFNHIAHLDNDLSHIRETELPDIRVNMVTKEEFRSFRTEMRWLFGIVLGFICSLMAILVF
ncbi:MAG: hypothetical protein IIA88_03575 [Bacteroidetes bacterium]|nr:hypothetical protein [Bacteroidota bacterium]